MTDETSTDAVLSIFDLCETDTAAEENGRWFRDVFNDGTNIDLKLRRLSSRASRKARANLDKIYRKHWKNGAYPEDIAIEILNRQLADGVIVDWDGIFDRNKEKILYTPEKAFDLLTKLPVFRDGILALCNSMENYRIEERKEVLGN